MSKEERFCGNCAWFKHEDVNGYGICYQSDGVYPHCGKMPCSGYVSERQMRHYMAVLLQHNRWRRDLHVPSIYRMPDPKEFGKAVDFACECMRVFSEL